MNNKESLLKCLIGGKVDGSQIVEAEKGFENFLGLLTMEQCMDYYRLNTQFTEDGPFLLP